MPILSRYLIRLYLPLFAVSMGLFIFVLVMHNFIRLLTIATMKGIPLWWIAKCFALLTPYFFSLAIPTAFLIALLLSLGQLAEDGEMTALRASGFSFRQILWPLGAFGLLLCALLFFLNHQVSPKGLKEFKNTRAKSFSQISRLDLEPNVFMEMGDFKLYARRVDKEKRRINGVYLFRYQGFAMSLRVSAEEGSYALEKGSGISMALTNGDIYIPNLEDPSRLTLAQFETYRIYIPAQAQADWQRNPGVREIDSLTLLKTLRRLGAGTAARGGMNPQAPDGAAFSPKDLAGFRTEISTRTALALSPLVFFLLGAPLGIRLEKRSRPMGFALSLLMIFFYYGFLVYGVGFGNRHPAWSWIAPWLPNFIGAASGLFLCVQMAKK